MVGFGLVNFCFRMGSCLVLLSYRGWCCRLSWRSSNANSSLIVTSTRKRELTVRAVLGSISGIAWSVAILSWLNTFEWAWQAYLNVRTFLTKAGLAGRGHCWLCGDSHAFRCIWRGEFRAAMSYNHYSVLLFVVMVMVCLSVGFLFPRVWRTLKRAVVRCDY